MAVDWTSKLLNLALGGIAWRIGTDIHHVRSTALARVGEINPLRHISANHDLLRALRLSWVRSALELLDRAAEAADSPEWAHARADLARFDVLARGPLRALRSAAFNRNADPGVSPVDAGLRAVLAGVPEFIGGDGQGGGGAQGGHQRDVLTDAFPETLAAVTGWPRDEIPALLLHLAADGVELHGHGGAHGHERRRFGELVFAEFADLVKDPNRYPQAGAAFGIAMQQALSGLAQQVLGLVQGIDARLDAALRDAGTDAAQWLRDGLAAQEQAQQRRHAELRGEIAALPQATVDALLQRLGGDGAALERKLLIALAQRLTPDEVRDVDRAVQELSHAVELAQQVLAAQALPAAGDAGTGGAEGFVVRVLNDVAEATRSGELDRSAHCVDGALAELDRREAEQRAELGRSRRRLLDAGLQQDLLRRDPWAAAERIEALVGLDLPGAAAGAVAASDAFVARTRQQVELGEGAVAALPLMVAAEMAQRIIEAQARGSAAWRQGLALRAQAQRALGQRESGSARLHEALALSRERLEALPADAATDERAEALADLSASLDALGWRQYDKALLQESIALQRRAAAMVARGADPLPWARTQERLVRALYTLGFREGSGALLAEAVEVADQALRGIRRDRHMAEWAMLQYRRGVALSMLARIDGQLLHFRLAVEAFEAAIAATPIETRANDWAAAHNDLGIALAALGGELKDVALLQRAVAAAEASLQVQTRALQPLRWAMTMHNLGGTLINIHLIQPDEAALRRAIEALRAARPEFDRQSAPVYVAANLADQSNALRLLGEHLADLPLLEEAAQAAQASLALRQREQAPLEWANVQLGLGQCLAARALLTGDAPLARDAERTLREALQEIGPERRPEEYRQAQQDLARLRPLLS